ncbi:MAG: type IV toxin-antitoxin system AbiEi family antitoxin domain-containing protein [Solirubrobacteraceae bacterium]
MRPSGAIRRIAARQSGRVTFAQLRASGLDRDRIRRWVADGRLVREHTGVFALGHPDPSPRGVYTSAWLAAGEGAAVSHRAAAQLLGIWPWRPAPPPEVTVPTIAHRRRPGIVIHRVASLDSLDIAPLDGLMITTVPRILLDLAPTTSDRELTRLCHEAWVRHRCGPDRIEACIARNPRKPGRSALRRALGSDVTLSDLEDAFVALVARNGLPRPRTNIDRQGDKVDCHWPAHGLTVEIVTFRYHATRQAFETDVARRRRSNHVAYSYGDVTERGPRTAADLRRRLSEPCPGA